MFTFKKEKGDMWTPDVHTIKFKKQECGYIIDKDPYKAYFAVEKIDPQKSDNPRCPWKWVIFAPKKEASSIEEMRKWVKGNTELIFKCFQKAGTPLYFFPD